MLTSFRLVLPYQKGICPQSGVSDRRETGQYEFILVWRQSNVGSCTLLRLQTRIDFKVKKHPEVLLYFGDSGVYSTDLGGTFLETPRKPCESILLKEEWPPEKWGNFIQDCKKGYMKRSRLENLLYASLVSFFSNGCHRAMNAVKALKTPKSGFVHTFTPYECVNMQILTKNYVNPHVSFWWKHCLGDFMSQKFPNLNETQMERSWMQD